MQISIDWPFIMLDVRGHAPRGHEGLECVMRRACAALVVVLPLLAACIPVPATIVQVMGIATSTPTLGPSSLSDTPTVPPTPPPPSPTAETPRRVASPLVPTVGGTATLVRGTAGTPATAAARATASALYYRLDV